jgi:uncharacterized protein YbgA (DUF1722 family)/uncharacterized protein YbbK (DUF523 family)
VSRGRIRVGVSSCLLGREVRWNGGHKRDPYLTTDLAGHFEWVAVCPEEEMGLGVPREPVRLEGDPRAPRLVARTTGTDLTARMQAFARRRVKALEALDLCGYILKARSPSCGMERVPVHGRASGARRGVGAFARVLMERLPLLPVEEEGRLQDPRLRENFIERVFACHRVKDLLAGGPAARDLVAFHTRHKCLVLAHSPDHYRRLGRLVAAASGARARAAARRYAALFMQALRVPATPRKHANVLQHILGFLKDDLPADDKREILHLIDDFRKERLPLLAPLVLLRHHSRRHKVRDVLEQVYLSPHPEELMLRNHV